MAQWFAYSLPDPAAPGLFPCIPVITSEEQNAEVNPYRKVDSGLKEPI